MLSVIIPAHNESQVIERLLGQLTYGASSDEIEIIVCCNGCSDDTAEKCRRFPFPVKVLETDVPSKIAALNMGDEASSCFPRLYLDADIQASWRVISRVAEVLERGPALAAAPQLSVDTSRSSWPVRAFYAIWLQLPYHRHGMIGSGFYALSKLGRARFARFPEIIADDGYVRALFHERERTTLTDCSFQITAPTNLWDLVRVKTRSRLGLWELGQRFPSTRPIEKKRWSESIVGLIARPSNWPSAIVYLCVVAITRFRAKRARKNLSNYQWERDESSRIA